MELLIYVVIVVGCLPFIVRWLAEEDLKTGKEPKFFVYPTTNLNRYVEMGGTKDPRGKWTGGVFVRVLPETPGFILGEDGTSRPAKKGERQKVGRINWFLYKTIGVYFYGIYPFRHIKTLDIPIKVDRVEGTGPADWIDSSRGNELVSGIRNQFPRPFVFTEVELGDGTGVDLKLVPIFRVVDPYIPAYKYSDGGYVKSASLLQSMVIDKLAEQGLTLADFKGKPKGELKGLLADFIAPKGNDSDGNEIPSDLNAEMIKQVGLTMESIGINDWRASNEDVRRALQASGIARETGDAKIIEAEKSKRVEVIHAEKDAQALGIRTEAQYQAEVKLATARAKRVRATVNSLKTKGADPTVVSRAAADVLEMEAAASNTSKITQVVKGQTTLVTPVGGNKS